MPDGSTVSGVGDPPFDVSATQRVRFDLGYDGSGFAGWAIQPGQRTVQGVLQDALTLLTRAPVQLTVAGRTDAGVHASGQVAHADLPVQMWRELGPRLIRRLSRILPDDVQVRSATPVSTDFDARFSALWRRYEYRICDDEIGPQPLRRFDVLAWRRPLDETAMQAAAQQLLGEHDFAAYCRAREGATSIRALHSLDVLRTGDLIVCTVQADAFCHSMVRSLVGALIAVGEGRRGQTWPAALLERAERSSEVTVAPAHGLTLTAVGYPQVDGLAARAALTRRRRGGTIQP